MILNNNMAALFALNELNRNSNRLGKAAKKAAAGLKLNSAGDDASGYSISEKNACAAAGIVTGCRKRSDRT